MLNRNSSARTAADSSSNDEVTTSIHTCTKPNFGSSAFLGCPNLSKINLFDNLSTKKIKCSLNVFDVAVLKEANVFFKTEYSKYDFLSSGNGFKRFCKILTAIKNNDAIIIDGVDTGFHYTLFVSLINYFIGVSKAKSKVFYLTTYNKEFIDCFSQIFYDNVFDLTLNKILQDNTIEPILVCENKIDLIFKYSVDEVVYVKSRYDGIIKTKIVSQVQFQNNPCYELEDTIKYHKDNYFIGSKRVIKETTNGFLGQNEEYECTPCPENVLMRIGDFIVDTHPFFFGLITDKILTVEMVS